MKTLILTTLIFISFKFAFANNKILKILPGVWISDEYSGTVVNDWIQRDGKAIYNKDKELSAIFTSTQDDRFSTLSKLLHCSRPMVPELNLIQYLIDEAKNNNTQLIYKAVDYHLYDKEFFVEKIVTEYTFSYEGADFPVKCFFDYFKNFVLNPRTMNILYLYEGPANKAKITILSSEKLMFEY